MKEVLNYFIVILMIVLQLFILSLNLRLETDIDRICVAVESNQSSVGELWK